MLKFQDLLGFRDPPTSRTSGTSSEAVSRIGRIRSKMKEVAKPAERNCTVSQMHQLSLLRGRLLKQFQGWAGLKSR
ncbi:hypothetical protein L5515_014659 [Caenorhabditis briggsae]|uniref:Uncharacterized protein n=1 Tax=Caenorhabditis briggsae TaxID=6238 RepID=A0AAE9EE11_CAEBR|nr:hypothetical protein L5515_014659 [Caenorhabditis briggsae]